MTDSAASGQSIAIVLAPPGSERVAVRALSAERSWRVRAVSDPMLAMTEVALASAAQGTHESLTIAVEDDDATDSHGISFVLVHPEKWKDRHELLEAITSYFPQTRLFAFDERGLHEASVNQKARCKRAAANQMSRSATEAGEAPPGERRPARKERSSSSITREEIDMLLGGAGGAGGMRR